jgi:hypothetical protein
MAHPCFEDVSDILSLSLSAWLQYSLAFSGTSTRVLFVYLSKRYPHIYGVIFSLSSSLFHLSMHHGARRQKA